MTDPMDYLAYLERTIGELKPGDIVEYLGPMTGCQGLWVVRAQIGDNTYTLADLTNEWCRLNASRVDLIRVEG